MRIGGISLDLQSMCLLATEFRFDAMLCSLGNKNSDAGHRICLHGPHLARGLQIHHPWSRHAHNGLMKILWIRILQYSNPKFRVFSNI